MSASSARLNSKDITLQDFAAHIRADVGRLPRRVDFSPRRSANRDGTIVHLQAFGAVARIGGRSALAHRSAVRQHDLR